VAAYEKAVKDSKAIAAKLGKGWKIRVWENLGWHWEVLSKCGRLRVGKSAVGYNAGIGESGDSGTHWYAHGKTPAAAIKRVLAVARGEIAALQSLVEGL
jgi:hypothetical protein